MATRHLRRTMSAAALGVLISLAAAAQEADEAADANAPEPPPSLLETAEASAAIGVVHMLDADYAYVRSFPRGGTAYLKVLLPYKGLDADEHIEIYEYGLHDNECYFPNPDVFEEGRRYLVFLRVDPENDERFRGFDNGCSLEVLVNDQNRYAVRWPLEGLEISDELDGLVEPMNFQDPYATIEWDSIDWQVRDEWIEAGWLEVVETDAGDALRYTHGIPVSAVRERIQPTLPTARN